MSCLVKCVCRIARNSEIIPCFFDYATGTIDGYPGLLQINVQDLPPVDQRACRELSMPDTVELTELLLKQGMYLAAIGYNGHYALLVTKRDITIYDCNARRYCGLHDAKINIPTLWYLGVVRTKVLTYHVKQTPALLVAEDVGNEWKFYLRDGIYYLPKNRCDMPVEFHCGTNVYWDLAKLSGYYGALYIDGMLTPFKTIDGKIVIERGEFLW